MAAESDASGVTVTLLEAGNGRKHTLQVDVGDDVGFFRFQVYSLTQIVPEDQRLIVAGRRLPDDPATDSLPLSALGVSAGSTIIVHTKTDSRTRREHDAAAAASSPSSSSSSSSSSSTSSAVPSLAQYLDLGATCTRTYLGDEMGADQPCALVDGRAVCAGCLASCQSAAFASFEARMSAAPFVCACKDVNGLCLYDAMAGTQVVEGEVREQLLHLLRERAKQQRAAAQGQGMERMTRQLASYGQAVQQYEDPLLQAKAQGVIPMEELRARARESMLAPREDGEEPLAFEDQLLVELLVWFKTSFFKWVTKPPCSTCQGGTRMQGMGATQPNPEERRWRAGITELYKCHSCGNTTRFPRYNHAGKLLETRCGRCGEWAQAFMLCLRAMGFEARMAYDWTDHVWCEVWSDAEQRWVHADPCEKTRDRPLMYEAGWGKKLTYVVAFNAFECVDVTRRYTNKWEEVLERRTQCPEDWLAERIHAMNSQRLGKLLDATKREAIRERQAAEQVWLAERQQRELDRALAPEELQGRQTGSVEWRRQRGELGDPDAARKLQEKRKCAVPPAGDGADEEVDDAAPAASHSKQIFQAYFKQLTSGCGDATCSNLFCKSSANFKFSTIKLGKKKAAIIAIKLAKQLKGKHRCVSNQ